MKVRCRRASNASVSCDQPIQRRYCTYSESSPSEIGNGRSQCRAATSPMTLIRDRNTINSMIRITLGNRTVPMDRTGAFVADPSHSNAANREVGGTDNNYSTAVTRGSFRRTILRMTAFQCHCRLAPPMAHYSFRKECRVTPTHQSPKSMCRHQGL